jgi:hypothetical protein
MPPSRLRASVLSAEEPHVLIDHRTYRVRPGTMQAHLDIYEQYGFAAQTRHLGKPVAYMFAESGDLNTIVHVWAYDNAGDRETKRAAMMADPDWQTYLKKNREAGYLQDQVTKLMVPAKFAPIIR